MPHNKISQGEIAQVSSSKVIRMSAISKTLFVKSVLWEGMSAMAESD